MSWKQVIGGTGDGYGFIVACTHEVAISENPQFEKKTCNFVEQLFLSDLEILQFFHDNIIELLVKKFFQSRCWLKEVLCLLTSNVVC